MAKDKFVALAFTDVNGDHKFNATKDTLIAGVLDTNRDGTVSIGDTLTWGEYPLQIDGSPSGTFGGANYNVVDVGESFPTGFGVEVITGSATSAFVFFRSGAGRESFFADNFNFVDDFSLVNGQDSVSVQVFAPPADTLPGLQDTAALDSAFHPGNDGFLDIFIA